jgi:taurine dioxygenase
MSVTLDAPAFTTETLSRVLGAAVIGLDLRRKLDEPTKHAVYAAFVRYHVLCFRDQHLDPEQQIAFTEQFGTLERHMARNRGTGNPLVHIVSNLGPDGERAAKLVQPDGTRTNHSVPSHRWRPSCTPRSCHPREAKPASPT